MDLAPNPFQLHGLVRGSSSDPFLAPWTRPGTQIAQNLIEVTYGPNSKPYIASDPAQLHRLVLLGTAQNVIEVIHGRNSEPCLAPWICQARQTAQNILEVTHGPRLEPAQQLVSSSQVDCIEWNRNNTRTYLHFTYLLTLPSTMGSSGQVA